MYPVRQAVQHDAVPTTVAPSLSSYNHLGVVASASRDEKPKKSSLFMHLFIEFYLEIFNRGKFDKITSKLPV
jgi:hypothetical protein